MRQYASELKHPSFRHGSAPGSFYPLLCEHPAYTNVSSSRDRLTAWARRLSPERDELAAQQVTGGKPSQAIGRAEPIFGMIGTTEGDAPARAGKGLRVASPSR